MTKNGMLEATTEWLWIAIIFVGIVFVGGWMAGLGGEQERADVVEAPSRQVAAWGALKDARPTYGPADAKFWIVSFMDLQCPGCRKMHRRLMELHSRHPESVAILYRHYPLEYLHPQAVAAAKAAECARTQNRFAEFVDVALARQESLRASNWSAIADSAGIHNLHTFVECVRSEGEPRRLSRDRSLGERLGIEVTPSVIAQGRLFPSPPSVERLEVMMERTEE